MTVDDRDDGDGYVEVGEGDAERSRVRVVKEGGGTGAGSSTEFGPGDDGFDHKLQRGVDTLDSGLVDLLAGFLDTETRAKVYLYLRKRGEATSEEIAEDTGLYPSTVRESLSDMYREGIVERRKKQTEGAGNNPYVYTTVPPSELARRFSENLEERLNKLFNLDAYLDSGRRHELKSEWSPYKIVVDSDDEGRDT